MCVASWVCAGASPCAGRRRHSEIRAACAAECVATGEAGCTQVRLAHVPNRRWRLLCCRQRLPMHRRQPFHPSWLRCFCGRPGASSATRSSAGCVDEIIRFARIWAVSRKLQCAACALGPDVFGAISAPSVPPIAVRPDASSISWQRRRSPPTRLSARGVAVGAVLRRPARAWPGPAAR